MSFFISIVTTLFLVCLPFAWISYFQSLCMYDMTLMKFMHQRQENILRASITNGFDLTTHIGILFMISVDLVHMILRFRWRFHYYSWQNIIHLDDISDCNDMVLHLGGGPWLYNDKSACIADVESRE